MSRALSSLRVGLGEDAHALEAGRALVLGGVAIPDAPHGPVAHSDGDALLHALADALLSAFALGDIGALFPPDDARYRDLPGPRLVAATLAHVRAHVGEVGVGNVAAVVTLDRPKLAPWRDAIRTSVAEQLGIEAQRVGLGLKTSEGTALGHVQARVSVLVAPASGG